MSRIPAGVAGMHEGRLMIDQPAQSARPANDPAEERYREQGRLFDTAVNNMSQGLVMFDAAERLLVCNRRYLEMYGLSPEAVKPGCTLLEMLRHRIAKGTFAPDPLEYRADLLAAMSEGRTIRRVTDTGDGRTVAVVNQPMEGGGWVATHEDITERLEAVKERDRAKAFLDTVIENVPVTLIVKNARDHRYVLINRAAEDLWGLPRAEVIGKHAHDMFAKEEADLIEARDAEVLQSSHHLLIAEHPMCTPRNGTRLVTTKRLVIRSPNGEPEYLLMVIEDVTERRHAEQRIAHLAHHDPLTDLPNRASFNEHLDAVVARATQSGEPFALLAIDLDRFKEVNDVFGHSAGDALLREVTARMKDAAEGAFVARLGGDEFTLICESGPQPATAEFLAERLQAAVAGVIEIAGHQLRIGLSIGVAIFPTDGTEAATLQGHADAALYRTKADGRGTVRFFEADMDRRLRERRALQRDLQCAVERSELVIHYQPQSRVGAGVIGFEALVRWHHPSRGRIAPNTFIPLAEESGLIISIGEWILRETCREAASWPRPLQIAVNLSPVQFQHGDLPGMVHAVLLETGLAANRLELEITEGVLIGDFSRALSILCRLKALGVRIAMDDFGTGYSSLSYLQSFPFDKIKIDQSFVSNLDRSSQSAAIIRAVIGLGRGLKLPVVAEGVETAEQLAFLTDEACDEVQGYLIGRPLPIEHYADLIGRAPIQTSNHSVAVR
jgi:diguanylate cyclase (GGDEF)-like protein/PAS domain S-box-containing protein